MQNPEMRGKSVPGELATHAITRRFSELALCEVRRVAFYGTRL
ncbi:hypothetical protein SAMN05444166_5215 [Singulisphaera sp. GP187]|nr:hypothetical protein SAMN05444166_5215 [Singulisphaera sp. GP187]